jgi:hypothetical protein
LADQLLPYGSHVCLDPVLVLGQRLLSRHHVAVARAYLAAPLGQLLGPLTEHKGVLAQPLEVALDMRQAHLPLLVRYPLIRGVAVAHHHALTKLAQDELTRRGVALWRDEVVGGLLALHAPDPAAFALVIPARLVAAHHRRVHARGAGLLLNRCQRGDQRLEAVLDGAKACGHTDVALKEVESLAAGGLQTDVEVADEAEQVFAVACGAGLDGRSRAGDVAAASAAAGQQAMLCDDRRKRGKLEGLLAKRRSVRAGVVKRKAAASADGRSMRDEVVNLGLIKQGAVVAIIACLAALSLVLVRRAARGRRVAQGRLAGASRACASSSAMRKSVSWSSARVACCST